MHVALVVPDRELWSGEARTVIAKTTEGDIGVLSGHAPVFGILAEGSLVEILSDDAEPVRAAVSGGFLSVANDKVSILAAHAQLGDEVDACAICTAATPCTGPPCGLSILTPTSSRSSEPFSSTGRGRRCRTRWSAGSPGSSSASVSVAIRVSGWMR